MFRAIMASFKRLFTSDGSAQPSNQSGVGNGHGRSGIKEIVSWQHNDFVTAVPLNAVPSAVKNLPLAAISSSRTDYNRLQKRARRAKQKQAAVAQALQSGIGMSFRLIL